MLPVNNALPPVPIAPPVVSPVATASAATIVPSAIAPSFSIVPAGDNARGNSALAGSPAPTAQALTSAPAPSTAPALPSPSFSLGSTNFLAQLIGQDLSPSAQTVLIEYEKLVYLSSIKYKPSDAMRPQAQPGDVFSRLVNEKRIIESNPVAYAAQIAEDGASLSSIVASAAPQPQSAPAPTRGGRPAPTAAQLAEAEEQAMTNILETTPVPPRAAAPSILSAYLSAAGRVNSQSISEGPSEIA